MVTGSPPEKGARARTKRRGVPVQIDELLARALSSDPTARPSLDEFESALAPFARVVPKDVKEPRFAIAEFRWLVPVIVVVVLAVLALTLGVEFANNLGKKKAQPTSSASAQAAALEITGARDFDPRGNGSENPQQVPDAYDGDQASAWSTLDYATADVGGKKGVGLIFDLGKVEPIGRLQLQTSLPGRDAEIRAANAQGTHASQYPLAKPVPRGSIAQTRHLEAGS